MGDRLVELSRELSSAMSDPVFARAPRWIVDPVIASRGVLGPGSDERGYQRARTALLLYRAWAEFYRRGAGSPATMNESI